jgi:hypothetical protein
MPPSYEEIHGGGDLRYPSVYGRGRIYAALNAAQHQRMKTVYTPQLDSDLVHQLYVKAKAQQVPMTVLTRNLLRGALELPQKSERPRVVRRRRRSRKAGPSARQVQK